MHARTYTGGMIVRRLARAGCVAASLAAASAALAAPLALDATPVALAQAMADRRVVLLGEVHDNAAQHALRAAALRALVEKGARPALAFEQFDRERQADVDRARRERPRDADYLIAQAQGSSDWDWPLYRPFVALALEFDLPIVAANLSRRDAMRVATQGWPAVFDAATIGALQLDALPPSLRRKQEAAIAAGHCDLLPARMIPAQANAQVARDVAMAQAIAPYATRGVVLLAGNGHARRDIGVPVWLPPDAARAALSIGLLEKDGESAVPEDAAAFDAYLVTAPAPREDPCVELRRQMTPAGKR